MILGLYALLSAAMFYLGSRATITEGLWSHYPAPIARFMDCPACTGFWWGVIWTITIGRRFDVDVGPVAAAAIEAPLIVGLCMIVLTPIVAAVMQHSLDTLGSVVPPDDEG